MMKRIIIYQAMENYYKQGKLKAIGISNYYTKEAVDEVLSHIAENYNIFDFELSQDDMNKIKNINKNQRYENW